MIRITLPLLTLAALTACQSTSKTSRHTVLSSADQQAMSPDQVVQRLEAGNARYRGSNLTPANLSAQIEASAGGQSPMAFVLSCVDSRVIPETVFDCSIGDLFVGRVAGNFENTDILGSMEYATAAVGTPLVVVLGHTSCGAVKGAVDQVDIAANLTSLLGNIQPAIAMTNESGDRTSANKPFVNAVVKHNVLKTVKDIQDRSRVMSDRVADEKLAIVGAIYDLTTGRVEWLMP